MRAQETIRNAGKYQEQMSGGGNAGNIPSPDVSRWSLFEATAAPQTVIQPIVTDDILTTTDAGAGNISVNPPDVNNGSSFTVSVVGGAFGLTQRVYHGLLWIYPQRVTTIRGTLRYRFDISAAASEYYVGISDRTDGTDPTLFSMVAVGFARSPNSPLGNWFLFVSKAGVIKSVDTLVPIVADVRYTFEIRVSNNIVSVLINGIPRTGITGNIPTVPLGLMWYIHGSAGAGGGTNFMTFEYLYAENSTP